MKKSSSYFWQERASASECNSYTYLSKSRRRFFKTNVVKSYYTNFNTNVCTCLSTPVRRNFDHFLLFSNFTPHCYGHLVLVQSLPMIHTSHQSMKNCNFLRLFSKCLECFWDHWGQRRLHGQGVKFTGWKNQNKCNKLKWQLEMGQNQKLPLKNRNRLLTFSDFELLLCSFDPFLAGKWP